MKVLNSFESLQKLCKALNSKSKVFFTRFGDNDIMMMSGTDLRGNPLRDKKYGGNKTVYSTELQIDLSKSMEISDPCYFKAVSVTWEVESGMRSGVFKPFSYKEALEKKISKFTEESEFLLPVLFQYLMCFNHELFEMFVDKYIRGKKILFIGSARREDVELIIGKVAYYIETPEVGAYDELESWVGNIVDVLDRNEVDVVIPNCGQAARAIQGAMWSFDYNVHSLDLGSIFDVFKEEKTRTWIYEEGNNIRKRYGVDENPLWVPSEGNSKKPKRFKPKTLAILIPTLKTEERRHSYLVIASELIKQINNNDLSSEIEIMKYADDGTLPIGYKRNELIREAHEFEYVCFVDDDDRVSPNYIKKIYDAISKNRGVDCVTFNGEVSIDGGNPQPYNYSIKHKEYLHSQEGYQRPPGHLTPIRRDIAVNYKFLELTKMRDRGSDVHWSLDLVKAEAVKTSVHIDEPLYFYDRILNKVTGT